MFAVEVAMDELAEACSLDPIELRIRNEPEVDPESGKPWSGRNLVGCLREGARRFGWDRRGTVAAADRKSRWLLGIGVAASTYPRYTLPGSKAMIRFGATSPWSSRLKTNSPLGPPGARLATTIALFRASDATPGQTRKRLRLSRSWSRSAAAVRR